jgi:metallo-beta-lactamase family protein
MKISFNGAAQTVTGSQYLIEVNGQRLLLECGLFQGKRMDTYSRNLSFPYPVKSVDAVVLSHAHIDHSGNLPNLVKQGYSRSIYATPATSKLAEIMLQDAGHIQEADARFLNRKRQMRGRDPVEPLYTQEDAAMVAPLFSPKPYGESFEPINGVTATLVDAGHILGSAAVVLDINENGRKFRFWFSGDIGRLKLPLLKDPVLPERADYLMMECTYGDKLHRDPEEAYAEFRQVVLETFERGGKVIIPAFAVGRTQEIVYSLNRMITDGDLPHIRTFVDSPLAVNTSRIFSQFPELFDKETADFVLAGKHPALNFPGLTYTQNVEESKAINEMKGPMIIISASGMAETGRILHHLRNNIENVNNTVMIVSWQAPDTLGRRLADRVPRVKIFGEEFEVRARIATIGGLSAHAGQDFLLKYAQASSPSLKRMYLVHGEERAETAFAAKLQEAGIGPMVYPRWQTSDEI